MAWRYNGIKDVSFILLVIMIMAPSQGRRMEIVEENIQNFRDRINA